MRITDSYNWFGPFFFFFFFPLWLWALGGLFRISAIGSHSANPRVPLGVIRPTWVVVPSHQKTCNAEQSDVLSLIGFGAKARICTLVFVIRAIRGGRITYIIWKLSFCYHIHALSTVSESNAPPRTRNQRHPSPKQRREKRKESDHP